MSSKKVLGVKFSSRTAVDTASLPGDTLAVARPTGMGRGRGRMLVDSDKATARMLAAKKIDPVQATLRHERAHLAPKRNTARLAERMADPARRGREEGRASYLAGENAKQYPRRQGMGATSEQQAFSRGYREVREKMRRAGTKTQLNKRLSAFGVIW